MRVIKARAFDGKTVRHDVTGFECDGGGRIEGVFLDGDYYRVSDSVEKEHGDIHPRAVVDWFTGLLDKNGKEIYEGDILYWYCKNGETNKLEMRVEYFDDRAMWGIIFGNGFDTFENYMEFGDVGKQFEVIGNIHEEQK